MPAGRTAHEDHHPSAAHPTAARRPAPRLERAPVHPDQDIEVAQEFELAVQTSCPQPSAVALHLTRLVVRMQQLRKIPALRFLVAHQWRVTEAATGETDARRLAVRQRSRRGRRCRHLATG